MKSTLLDSQGNIWNDKNNGDVSTKQHSSDKDSFLTAEGAIDSFLFFLFRPDLNYVIQTSQLSQSVYVLL